MQKPEVVFFGSGPVAAKSLELLQNHCKIEAVITKPTTLKQMSAVANNTKVYAVKNKSELDELFSSTPFQSKLGVLIDFGIIVSRKVIDSFDKGIINSHFSLLPEWRGADPITFAILSGQTKTGVSLMLIVEAMDEGPIISCGIQEIENSETTPELTEKLIFLSDALLKKQIPRYLTDAEKGVAQSKMSEMIPDYPSKTSYSRKLTKHDGILDFTKPAKTLEREIRAFKAWPKSRTTLAGIDVIITQASTLRNSGDSGKYEINGKQLLIYCGDGALNIEKLKPASKNEMTAEAFLAGQKNIK